MLGLNGSVNYNTFQTKAEALKFAIDYNLRVDDKGYVYVDKEGTKDLYNFICENVNLPDTQNDYTKTISDSVSDFLMHYKNEKIY